MQLQNTDLGRNTTAYLANYFVSKSTAAFLKGLLDNNTETTLLTLPLSLIHASTNPKKALPETGASLMLINSPRECQVNYYSDETENSFFIFKLNHQVMFVSTV